MSAATRTDQGTRRAGLSAIGIVQSEALKLLSVPSTVWGYAVMAAITIGITAQTAAATSFDWYDGRVSQAGMQAAGADAIGMSTDLNVLVVSILGVLVIAGEHGTGMIRSTFVAVPRRTPVLVAKLAVFAGCTAAIAVVATAVAVAASVVLLRGNGIVVRLDDPHYWGAVVGSVLYLVAIGLLAFAIAALLRGVVSSIAVTLGVVFVVPIALGFAGAVLESQTWLRNLSLLLPFNLGQALVSHPGYADFASPGLPIEPEDGVWALEPWQGALGVVLWVAVPLTIAIVTARRRDV